jgi:hypothetical protein
VFPDVPNTTTLPDAAEVVAAATVATAAVPIAVPPDITEAWMPCNVVSPEMEMDHRPEEAVVV